MVAGDSLTGGRANRGRATVTRSDFFLREIEANEIPEGQWCVRIQKLVGKHVVLRWVFRKVQRDRETQVLSEALQVTAYATSVGSKLDALHELVQVG